MKKTIYIVITAIVATLMFSSCSYNAMVSKQEAVTAQWGQVQNSYQRRADLIPNLVNTVKGYAEHEQETLTRVIEARAKASQTTVNPEDLSAEQVQNFQNAQSELSQALGRLLVTFERYPDLKANENFLALQDELAGTENRIAVERNRYNDIARDYNSYIRQFPRVIYAGLFGFKKKGYFEAASDAQSAPKVEF